MFFIDVIVICTLWMTVNTCQWYERFLCGLQLPVYHPTLLLAGNYLAEFFQPIRDSKVKYIYIYIYIGVFRRVCSCTTVLSSFSRWRWIQPNLYLRFETWSLHATLYPMWFSISSTGLWDHFFSLDKCIFLIIGVACMSAASEAIFTHTGRHKSFTCRFQFVYQQIVYIFSFGSKFHSLLCLNACQIYVCK